MKLLLITLYLIIGFGFSIWSIKNLYEEEYKNLYSPTAFVIVANVLLLKTMFILTLTWSLIAVGAVLLRIIMLCLRVIYKKESE